MDNEVIGLVKNGCDLHRLQQYFHGSPSVRSFWRLLCCSANMPSCRGPLWQAVSGASEIFPCVSSVAHAVFEAQLDYLALTLSSYQINPNERVTQYSTGGLHSSDATLLLRRATSDGPRLQENQSGRVWRRFPDGSCCSHNRPFVHKGRVGQCAVS